MQQLLLQQGVLTYIIASNLPKHENLLSDGNDAQHEETLSNVSIGLTCPGLATFF